jgi:uncharacterized paraquat-inducible protein A
MNCDFRYHQPIQCPKCKKNSLRNPDQMRTNGIMLMLLSLFLTAIMIGVFALIAFVVLGMRTRPLTDGDVFQFAMFMPALIAVLLFGVMFGFEGLWRAATGTATRWIVKLFSYVAYALLLLSFVIRLAALFLL